MSELDDPRGASNGTRHDFREILVISICAMLSNADSFDDIAHWGRVKEAWLRRFLVLKNGIPSHDTFDRVFRALDPAQFETVFRQWVSGIATALGGQIAVDGKTLHGSADEGPPVHMVSAFATDVGLALGQEKVAGKSNEITAIPVLLETLYLKGFLVSIDAMACQREIAATITAKGGDYLPPRQNSCRLFMMLNLEAIRMRDGTVRRSIQETGGGAVVATGERRDWRGFTGSWGFGADIGTVA